MKNWNLLGENLVAVGTDGANVMCGPNHSLVTLLKRTWPHIIHLKCVNHSIDLIAKQAVKLALPSHIDYMIRETYNWFAHSSLRLNSYREVAKLVGFSTVVLDEDEAPQASESQGVAPPKLISPSETRWLVLADCIEKSIGQYDALKAHFDIVYTKERCFQAKNSRDMFMDERNYLYLLFLFPILKELRRLSNLFQSNSSDNFRIYSELETTFQSLGVRILKPSIEHHKTVRDLTEYH